MNNQINWRDPAKKSPDIGKRCIILERFLTYKGDIDTIYTNRAYGESGWENIIEDHYVVAWCYADEMINSVPLELREVVYGA